MIKIGDKNSFLVMRKSDLGYMLVNKGEQVLLHFNQAMGKDFKENDIVDCFVQYDSKGRVSATLEEPSATISKPGWVKVVECNARLGVFVSINTFKDVLISKDDLPLNVNYWPHLGDMLYVKLFEKKGRLNALILSKQELIEINPILPDVKLGEKIKAHVVRASEYAVNAITDDLSYIYISSKQFRGAYHIGQEVEVMIIGRHEDELVGSLNKVKEEMVDSDSKVILNYLEKHKVMPYTSKTDASTIEKVFHMSRKAFKRALGDLYKNKKVLCTDEETRIL